MRVNRFKAITDIKKIIFITKVRLLNFENTININLLYNN